jgi:hypothetical protein
MTTASIKLDEASENDRLSEILALAPPVGWHRDPWRQHDLRYHDGRQWTEHVTHFGPVPCQGCDLGTQPIVR